MTYNMTNVVSNLRKLAQISGFSSRANNGKQSGHKQNLCMIENKLLVMPVQTSATSVPYM